MLLCYNPNLKGGLHRSTVSWLFSNLSPLFAIVPLSSLPLSRFSRMQRVVLWTYLTLGLSDVSHVQVHAAHFQIFTEVTTKPLCVYTKVTLSQFVPTLVMCPGWFGEGTSLHSTESVLPLQIAISECLSLWTSLSSFSSELSIFCLHQYITMMTVAMIYYFKGLIKILP